MQLQILTEILDEIWRYAEEERVSLLERVFQTQMGGYGYGDQIAGVRTPILRQIAKHNKDISLDAVELLLQEDLHEARFVALVILIHKFKKQQADVFDIYLRNTRFINNWDLVDISSPHIVGEFCARMGSVDCIWELAKSNDLWENRISIVSSWAFVKRKDVTLTIELCKHFMNHKHHLIHKACGWMLREVGKKDEKCLINFLNQHKIGLPRVTFSYAKERIIKKGVRI